MEGQGWFLQQGSERIGPLSTEALRERVLAGGVNPRADLLWRGGMQSWMPAGAVEEFFSKTPTAAFPTLAPLTAPGPAPASAPTSSPTLSPSPSPASSASPFGNPAAATAVAPTFAQTPLASPVQPAVVVRSEDLPSREPEFSPAAPAGEEQPSGSGRASFLAVCFIFPLVGGAIIASTGRFLGTQMGTEYRWAYMGMLLLIPALLGFAVLKRLENLQMSRVWGLALPVPLLNTWLGYRLVACPPGYGAGRKMDGPGIFLAVVYWLTVFVSTALLVIFSAAVLRTAMTRMEELSGRSISGGPKKGTPPAEVAPRASASTSARPQPLRPQTVRTLPPVGPLMAEVDAAWQKGPRALQALSLELERKRQIDRDGFSNRSQFTEWFGSDARIAEPEETLRVLELWKKADPNRPDPWMASAELHAVSLRILLRVASDGTPATLPKNVVRQFEIHLKGAQDDLGTAPNRQYHPSYYVNSLMLLRTQGATRPAIEAMAQEAVSRFPECPAVYSEIALSLAPRYGGAPGEWESKLSGWISSLPPQRRPRAYAIALTTVLNDWFPTTEGRREVIGPVRGKVDRALYEEGIRLLSESYPSGAYFENSSILAYGVLFASREDLQKAILASKGVVNLRVWRSEEVYKQALVAWQ